MAKVFARRNRRSWMTTLYHYWLSQGSRFIRLLLAEKGIGFDLALAKPWAPGESFLSLNPSGWPPVLAPGGGVPALADARAIAEYIDERHPQPVMLGQNAVARAEVRRLVGWFDYKFAVEVSDTLLFERHYRGMIRGGAPDPAAIRTARTNIRFHLDYIGHLFERRRWLAGEEMSLADLMAAAHLSVVDYLGEAPWDEFQEARQWYSRMKSRPSFRPLLADRVAGLAPPAHYDDLDF